MKLIGQYDSPFVRRVAVALQIYGIVYDHVPWSTFGDGDLVARHNPLKRVPALVLDDGEVLIESGAILDYLDERVGPDRALLPLSGAARRAALRRIALMTGAADKAVSFFYAKLFSAALAPDFVSRCEGQIRTALAAIDRECGARVGDWWHGATPGHDDIAVACVARFIREAYPDLFDPEALPALSSHCARAEALPVFSAVEQTFTPPKG